jgi:copper chaperone CopZ
MFLLTSLTACFGLAAGKNDVRKITISGMHCDNCSAKVVKALKAVKGVQKVAVNREKGEAAVTIAANAKVETVVLVNAVAKAGYEAKSGTIEAKPAEACDDDCKDGDHKDHDSSKHKDASDAKDCCSTKDVKKKS